MIVKFHPRGRGGGAGPVDYLLGKDRQRDGASVLQGKPEEVRELIDASPYAKKYTSGVLSFAEKDLPPGQREKLMAGFEQVLMPGLDKDQYSVLWVEHRDKGRLELNFLIPNTELLTGRRLQPYYDRADRPRIDAWQTIVNGRLGLHDPNAPENRRALVTPSALPEAKLEAAQAITRGLLTLAASGELKTRQDVTEALKSAGFDVVRTTKSSISIADPDGGRNIRLKGAIYEQSFNAGEELRAEIESAAADYRRDAESRIQRAREVCQSGTERKREENQRRHPRPRPETVLGHEPAHERHGAHGQPDVADHRPGVRAADSLRRGHSVVAGTADSRQLHDHPGADAHAGHAVREEQRRAAHDLRGEETPLREGEPGSGTIRRGFELDDTGGEIAHDRAGKTVAERIRAATAGLLEKAGRVGERLRGMADDVWSYATGERGAERARHGLEQAGAEFERAAAPVVERLNGIETHREQVRAAQHQKELELERSQRQRTYDGPSL
ncbi:plasmid mobilization relaxase MbeA [Enterobacter hormaechei]|uniref:plasmid mobilization relaxase MbeA n=1 Tax=Enterobacter hormaechei TaxID=158836 RepID=UPI000581C3E0|nr:DNA polymerase [Enterobacter hormaechei subsp. steigerwaltii]KJO24110.1 DNA polymerase [Enterobacter hormaechei subsp. steigerwaltii]